MLYMPYLSFPKPSNVENLGFFDPSFQQRSPCDVGNGDLYNLKTPWYSLVSYNIATEKVTTSFRC